MSALKTEFAKGWTVVLASTVGFALGGSGLIFYTSGVFLDALRNEFHWPVASLQSGLILIGLLSFVLTPSIGWLSDRFGSRAVAIPSMIAFGLCFMGLSREDGRYSTFLALWALLAIASAGTQAIVWSRAVSGWFSAGRGMALGITLLGTGVTAMVAPPLAAHIIERHGWRMAYIALGGGALCLSLPLLFLFLRDNVAARGSVATPLAGCSTGEALKNWRFWIIGFCLLCVTFTVAGVISNFIKLMTGHGFSRSQAAWVASMSGVFIIFGRLACGALLDRLHGPFVGAAFFLGLPVACLLLSASTLGLPAALVAASLLGLGAAAEFDVIPYLVSRYFGLRKLGSILGLVTLFFQLGSVAPVLFGAVYDHLGGYRVMLWIAAVVSTAGPVSLLLLGAYPTSFSPSALAPTSVDHTPPPGV